MPLALLLLLQAAPAASAPAPAAQGQRFSILTDPCANASNDGGDVVVCGKAETLAPRMPMPQFRGVPDHAVPSNPELRPEVALNGPGVGNECGAYLEDCPGLGNQVNPIALAAGAVNAIGNAFKTRKYKNKGEPIPMDDAPVDTRGKILP